MIQNLLKKNRLFVAGGRAIADEFEQRAALNPVARSRERLVLTLYLRAIAVMMLVAGIIHWCRILGLTEWRSLFFAEMPVAWQVSTVYFAVVQLVAGIGLWMTVGWGTVMWVIVAASQIASHTVFADEFGTRPWELSFYFLTISLFLILRDRSDRGER